MHHYPRVIGVIGLAAVVLACGIASAPGSQPPGVSTFVASTLQALKAPAQSLPGAPVTYANVSLVIPPGLATGASSQTVPAAGEQNGGPWGAAPQHTEFAFIGYGLPPGSFSTMLIDVYPAAEYAATNAGAEMSLQRLKTVLSNPALANTKDTLPQVPYFNAAPMFEAQVKAVKFNDGSGVRMITQYGQAPGPATNNGTFYHFEGLTTDGKYLVIAVLPIQAPFLENGNDPAAPAPAGAIPFPGYNYSAPNFLDAYYQAVTDKLNATQADTFQPSLNSLDALIQSLRVSP